MKYTQFLFLVTVIISLNSCFVADAVYGEPKKPKLSLKQKTQNIITSHVKQKTQNYTYNKYGFSELIIYKPEKLIALDSLKEFRKNKRVNQNDLELDIAELEKEIKDEDVKYTLEMDHIYSLRDVETSVLKLYETRFFMDDSLRVTDVQQLLLLELDWVDEVAFSNYFYETSIFEEGDYYQSKLLSREFYSFFKKRQEELIGLKEKSDFLKHTLWLCNEVKTMGSFEQDLVLRKMTVNRFKTNSEILDYKMLEFSNLYEINDSKNLKGYYFFHKFSHSNNEIEDTSAVYVGFSSYYEIEEILEIKEPYKQHFDE